MSQVHEAQIRRLLIAAQDLIDRKAPVKWRMAQAMMLEIVRLRKMLHASQRRISRTEAEIERLEIHGGGGTEGPAAGAGDDVRRGPTPDVDPGNG